MERRGMFTDGGHFFRAAVRRVAKGKPSAMRIVLTLLQDMDLECAGTEGSDQPRRIEIRWKDPDWASAHGSNIVKLRDAKDLTDEELMRIAQEGRPGEK